MKLREQITIFSADGSTLAEVTPEKGSRRVANLMQDDYIELKFSLANAVRFPRGSWAMVANEAHRTASRRYIVADEVLPTYNTATGGYDYQMRLDAWHYSWQRYKFTLAPTYGAAQTAFDYTEAIDGHVRLLHQQLTALAVTDPTIQLPTAYALHYNGRTDLWAVADAAQVQTEGTQTLTDARFVADGESGAGSPLFVLTDGAAGTLAKIQTIETEPVDPDTNEAAMLLTDEVRHVSYSDLNIIEAINTMCGEDAFNCEWWMDDGSILHFGRCEYGTPIEWQRGRDYPSMTRSRSSDEYGTRLIAFGSTQNVPSRYRKQYVGQVTDHAETSTQVAYLDDCIAFGQDNIETGAAPEGATVTRTYETYSSVFATVEQMHFVISANAIISAEVEPYEEGATAATLEVWLGERGNGGTLLGTASATPSANNEEKVFDLDTTADVTDPNPGREVDIHAYLTITGKAGEVDASIDPSVDAAFCPKYEFEAVVSVTTQSQTLYDSTRRITADAMQPSSRLAATATGESLATQSLTMTGGTGYQKVGTTDFRSATVAGGAYTFRYRWAVYVELPTGYTAGAPFGRLYINIGNYAEVEVAQSWLNRQPQESGLYVVEMEMQQLWPTTRTGEADITLHWVSAVAGVKVYLYDLDKGADLALTVWADYYDPQTEKTVRPTGLTVKTQIWKTDALGMANGTAYDCEIDGTGTITIPSIDASERFTTGDYFTVADVQLSRVALAWLTDRYSDGMLSSYTRRLMLPLDTCPKNYIDSPRIQTDGVTRTPEVVEVVKVFDNIYPTQVLTVADVIEGTADKTITDDDGTQTVVQIPQYTLHVRKADFTFTRSAIMGSNELECIFQSGRCAGMTFGLQFDGDVRVTTTAGGEAVQAYTIVINDTTGVDMPNAVLHPETGDKFVLLNYNPAEITDLGLVDAAERRLETAARAYLDKISLDASTYVVPLRADVAEERFRTGAGYPTIGHKIALVDDTYFDGERETRVIGYERPLDIPFDDPKFTLGESLRYSRLGKIEKDSGKR